MVINLKGHNPNTPWQLILPLNPPILINKQRHEWKRPRESLITKRIENLVQIERIALVQNEEIIHYLYWCDDTNYIHVLEGEPWAEVLSGDELVSGHCLLLVDE